MSEKEMALQQFIGYGSAKDGSSVTALIESMALTAVEWIEVKTEAARWLPDIDVEEIDSYFAKQS